VRRLIRPIQPLGARVRQAGREPHDLVGIAVDQRERREAFLIHHQPMLASEVFTMGDSPTTLTVSDTAPISRTMGRLSVSASWSGILSSTCVLKPGNSTTIL